MVKAIRARGLSRRSANEAVDDILILISTTLASGGSVNLKGVGTLVNLDCGRIKFTKSRTKVTLTQELKTVSDVFRT